MTWVFTSTLFAAGLLATAASAQATVPGSENTQPPGFHNNMMPVKPLPVRHHRRPAHKPATTSAPSNSAASSSKPSSSTGSSAASSSAASSQDATPASPDQGKPGTLTRPQGNTTTMHMPGSENPADTGPGAPKN